MKNIQVVTLFFASFGLMIAFNNCSDVGFQNADSAFRIADNDKNGDDDNVNPLGNSGRFYNKWWPTLH